MLQSRHAVIFGILHLLSICNELNVWASSTGPVCSQGVEYFCDLTDPTGRQFLICVPGVPKPIKLTCFHGTVCVKRNDVISCVLRSKAVGRETTVEETSVETTKKTTASLSTAKPTEITLPAIEAETSTQTTTTVEPTEATTTPTTTQSTLKTRQTNGNILTQILRIAEPTEATVTQGTEKRSETTTAIESGTADTLKQLFIPDLSISTITKILHLTSKPTEPGDMNPDFTTNPISIGSETQGTQSSLTSFSPTKILTFGPELTQDAYRMENTKRENNEGEMDEKDGRKEEENDVNEEKKVSGEETTPGAKKTATYRVSETTRPLIPNVLIEETGENQASAVKTLHLKEPHIVTGIPGNLHPERTPFFVYFSFDDAVNSLNSMSYKSLFSLDRRNANGCPITGTLFVSNDYTQYGWVKYFHEHGWEIADHSISHRSPTTWWQTMATYNDLEYEIGGMRDILATKAKVPVKDVAGMRMPFLAVSPLQFKVLENERFGYDSSLTEYEPIWPYKIQGDLWEIPLNMFYKNSTLCGAMLDTCRPANFKESFEYIWENFKRHYDSPNRAPFGLNMHAAWFLHPAWRYNFDALDKFVQEIVKLDDVWIVNPSQLLKWIKDPVPIDRMKNHPNFACPWYYRKS